jgi:hypothetical protein
VSAIDVALEVGVTERSVTTRDGSATAKGLSSSPSTKLKMAEFAPIARAIETTAVNVNPGFWRRARIA